MNIGLFLDVDRTLTAGPIQHTFARHLGVEEAYQDLERRYEQGSVTSTGFGKSVILMFNDAGFDRSLAEDLYEQVERTDWCGDLLTLPVHKYLVSAGPSYYVKRLGQEFEIPEENILCSEYAFATDGKLKGCRAVSATRKQNFVIDRKSAHSLTVGLGDLHKHDGQFVSECHIPILTEQALGFLHAEGLDAVQTMVARLAAQQTTQRTEPTVFIGSSTENLGLANAMYEHLAKGCKPRTWEDGIFQPGKVNIESLEASLSDFDFAVFVMGGDDVKVVRGVESLAVRDNILFELGLFMGRLGRTRCFLLYPRGNRPNLPSDIDGVVRLDYSEKNDPLQSLKAGALHILRTIEKLKTRELRI